MADLSKFSIPVKNPSTGQVTNETFDLYSSLSTTREIISASDITLGAHCTSGNIIICKVYAEYNAKNTLLILNADIVIENIAFDIHNAGLEICNIPTKLRPNNSKYLGTIGFIGNDTSWNTTAHMTELAYGDLLTNGDIRIDKSYVVYPPKDGMLRIAIPRTVITL